MRSAIIVNLLAVLLLVLWPQSGRTAVAANNKSNAKADKKPVIRSTPPSFKEDFHRYCFNNADAAIEAKFAWQAKQIADSEAKLQKLIKRLKKQKDEYEAWVKRREEFINRVTDSLVSIYATMDPEVAAAQIAHLDYDSAASILTKLKSRSASAILNEMAPETAGRLVRALVGATDVENEKEKGR